MTTEVPGTQNEAMPDASGNGNGNGLDEDIIIGKDDLVIRVVSLVLMCHSHRR